MKPPDEVVTAYMISLKNVEVTSLSRASLISYLKGIGFEREKVEEASRH